MSRIGRNEPCPCGSGRKYKRCCIDKPTPASAAAPPQGPAANSMTLVIETADGVLFRDVLEASPLRRDIDQGAAAEEAAHDAAALWGLPDFVYRAGQKRVGSGTREIGDGLLLVGDVGLVVQVKSREGDLGDEERERRWILKHTRRAIRQGRGSIRRLQRDATRMRNARGVEIEVAPGVEWLVVAVIDHPDPPDDIDLADLEEFGPGVSVLLRRDWEFLFEQLKSTRAVASYFARTAGEAVRLGDEPLRYFDLAAADIAADPKPLDPALLGDGARTVSSPLLPMEAAGARDREGHLVVRSILEDVAAAPAGDLAVADRLQVLADLDYLPVAERAAIGRFLLVNLQRVARIRTGTAWQFRRILSKPTPARVLQLGFGVSNQLDDLHRAAFSSWVQLRHFEVCERLEDPESVTTVGVILTPRYDGQRPWDTTAIGVTGKLGLVPEELESFRELWRTATGNPSPDE
jgi:hypothetical protein